MSIERNAQDVAEVLVSNARAIGEPCGGRQCWRDLVDEFPRLTEGEARHIVLTTVARIEGS